MHSTGAAIDPESLAGSELFSDLGESGIAALAAQGWVVRLERASRVLSRGDRLDGLYVVL